ncbi:MAG TPA: glycosyltransferase [Chlamydiales bacterium]
MKTAIVHDWLTSAVGGGEDSLKEIHTLFPSPIYTLVENKKELKGSYFEDKEIHTSFIQRLPSAATKYRRYLPFFPMAIEGFDLSAFDCVLSSSHCAAKGIISHPDQLHICYCYTPVRYAWDLTHQYLAESGLNKGLKGALTRWLLHRFRQWDAVASHRVDEFIAISHFVARRIQKFYGRKATVIYPPVNLEYHQLHEQKEDYYITASRFVPYKKIDLIVEAFAQMPDKKLIVIGSGPDEKKIKSKAAKNVEILGYQPDEVLKKHLQKAKAFVFAAVEDFGILPIQAMASGTPVIALRKGGAMETVQESIGGLFFEEQSVDCLKQAVVAFDKKSFTPALVRKSVEHFSDSRFRNEFRAFVENKYKAFKNR